MNLLALLMNVCFLALLTIGIQHFSASIAPLKFKTI